VGEREGETEAKKPIVYCGQDHATDYQTFNLEMVIGKKSKGAQRDAMGY